MTDEDKILEFLRLNGPSLPTKVAKNIAKDIIIASAFLSDLKSRKKVNISSLKIGGSPLYFLPGQEEKLYDFAAGNMNPKDFDVLQDLKEKKIFRESDLELLPKVALRSLKDFAIPLQVTVGNQAELFWKWHLLPDEETNELIRDKLSIKNKEPEVVEDLAPEEIKTSDKEVQKELKEEMVTKEGNSVSVEVPDKPETEKLVAEETPKKKDKKEEPEEETIEHAINNVIKEKKPFLQKFKDKVVRKKRKAITEDFVPLIEKFFKSSEINIEQKETVRKNSEINFMVHVPSVVGKIKYFCKAKKKLRCDEKDLSTAFMESQIKKLPLLFLYSNEINKKAQEMLDSGAFENVVVKKIE
jgi:hypothetical protein